jgi:hypothetical protein
MIVGYLKYPELINVLYICVNSQLIIGLTNNPPARIMATASISEAIFIELFITLLLKSEGKISTTRGA